MLYNSRFLVLNHTKFSKIWYRIPFYSNALCNHIFVRIWNFLSTSFDKQVSEPFEPSNDSCTALSNCVPAYVWWNNFREVTTKKLLGLFLMRSKQGLREEGARGALYPGPVGTGAREDKKSTLSFSVFKPKITNLRQLPADMGRLQHKCNRLQLWINKITM